MSLNCLQGHCQTERLLVGSPVKDILYIEVFVHCAISIIFYVLIFYLIFVTFLIFPGGFSQCENAKG